MMSSYGSTRTFGCCPKERVRERQDVHASFVIDPLILLSVSTVSWYIEFAGYAALGPEDFAAMHASCVFPCISLAWTSKV